MHGLLFTKELENDFLNIYWRFSEILVIQAFLISTELQFTLFICKALAWFISIGKH